MEVTVAIERFACQVVWSVYEVSDKSRSLGSDGKGPRQG